MGLFSSLGVVTGCVLEVLHPQAYWACLLWELLERLLEISQNDGVPSGGTKRILSREKPT